jgi:hypothetical protein
MQQWMEVQMAEYLKIADIGDGGKAKVKELEKTLGAHVMAFVPGLSLAELTETQKEEVALAEMELGVILLVYKE